VLKSADSAHFRKWGRPTAEYSGMVISAAAETVFDAGSLPAQFLPSMAQIDQILQKKMLLRDLSNSGLTQEEFAASRGISRTTLWSYRLKDKKGAYELIDQRPLKSGRKIEIDAPAAAWILAQITAHPKIKVRKLHKDLEKEAVVRDWKVLPSYDQVLRFAKNMSPELAAGLRRGPRAHFEEFGQIVSQTVEAPNEVWQVDCTEIPVWVLNINTGKLGKVWMTTFIDTATRVVPVCFITPGHPTSRDIVRALKKAILPKHCDAFPFYGKPDAIQSDNHNVFKGEFLEALLELGITPIYSPVECPSKNGKVERLFRTFAEQLFSGLRGYSKQFQGLERAKGNPIPLPLLDRIIERYLVEYHTNLHRTLGRSPWEAWHEQIEAAKGLVFSEDEISEAMQFRVEKLVVRGRVEVEKGLFYLSPDLAAFSGEYVTLKVPPEGPGAKIRAYHRDKLIGELRRETDTSMANDIAGARVSRSIDLQGLRKTLLDMADAAAAPIGGQMPAPSSQLPPASEEAQVDSADEDLSTVTDLSSEDTV
jgi:transposase InsO family protein